MSGRIYQPALVAFSKRKPAEQLHLYAIVIDGVVRQWCVTESGARNVVANHKALGIAATYEAHAMFTKGGKPC